MSESKHTPGPWSFARRQAHVDAEEAIREAIQVFREHGLAVHASLRAAELGRIYPGIDRLLYIRDARERLATISTALQQAEQAMEAI